MRNLRYFAVFHQEKCYCDKRDLCFAADLCVKKAVSSFPTADSAVRYTNCTIITSFTFPVSGSIGELLDWSRASNGNKEEFRFSVKANCRKGRWEARHSNSCEIYQTNTVNPQLNDTHSDSSPTQSSRFERK
jgi:hypothetical protein